mmetsp:Transcript_7056/g.43361  ORF Transcript_7056/g.43361 Transcript_7056/m.43361 type:complete len:229 (+) Transcript_7056:2810-3496(+)
MRLDPSLVPNPPVFWICSFSHPCTARKVACPPSSQHRLLAADRPAACIWWPGVHPTASAAQARVQPTSRPGYQEAAPAVLPTSSAAFLDRGRAPRSFPIQPIVSLGWHPRHDASRMQPRPWPWPRPRSLPRVANDARSAANAPVPPSASRCETACASCADPRDDHEDFLDQFDGRSTSERVNSTTGEGFERLLSSDGGQSRTEGQAVGQEERQRCAAAQHASWKVPEA